MKLFENNRKGGKFIGIEEGRTFTRRNVFVLLLYVLFFVTSTAFILFDANTFEDYSEAFFAWASVLFTGVGFLIYILQSKDIFRVIRHFEQIIENRQ